MVEQERYRATATKKNSSSSSGTGRNSTEEAKAKNFINSFVEYIKSGRYRETLDRVAKRFSLPPNKVAHNFFTKVLGVISDALHIVINVGSSIVDATLSALCVVLHSAVTVVKSVANSLATLVTAGYTNNECAAEI